MAWTAITDIPARTSDMSSMYADVNDLQTNIERLQEKIETIGGNGDAAPASDIETLAGDVSDVAGDLSDLEDRVEDLENATTSAKSTITKNAGGFWFDVIWKDTDEIIIKKKDAHGIGAWIGVVLNDGTYIESTSDITVKYDTPANSGHILDGITAKLASSRLRLWAYENSGGSLAFGLTFIPKTTFSNNNPTNSLTLGQVNSQNIGYLFPANANLLVWSSGSKFETWLYNTTGGHTPAGACYVSSRNATTLTLDGNLAVSDFSASDYVMQIDNFKPLQVSDGNIASAIGAKGYLDTGITLYTDGSANLYQFTISDGWFMFTDIGADWTGFTYASGIVLILEAPPDADILKAYWDQTGVNPSKWKYYNATNYNQVLNSAGIIIPYELHVKHGIADTVCGAWYLQGYKIKK